MNPDVFRYVFEPAVPMQDVEDTLQLSVLSVSSLFGESSVRLDASFAMDVDRRGCVIDGSTEVGRALSKVFTGFACKEFGDGSFTVRRVKPAEPASLAA